MRENINISQFERLLFSDFNNISARKMHCHFCNVELEIEEVHPGEQVICPQCKQTLIRIDYHPSLIPVIYGLLALFAFFLSLTFTLISVEIPYIKNVTNASIWNIFQTLSYSGYIFLALVFVLFVIIAPILFVSFTLYVYIGFLLKIKLPGIRSIAYIMCKLRQWIMVDIFFISVLISLVKVQALAEVHFGYTMVTLFAYSIFLARIVLSISEYWVKEKIANLNQQIYLPKRKTMQEIQKETKVKIHLSWALLLTAIIFYIPANFFPMMITDGVSFHYKSTLLEGIVQIWTTGDYIVSSVIFIASFLIPIAKIFILFIILLAVSDKRLLSSKALTNLYVIIERIGRWSMIDVFVIMLMTTLFTTRVVSIFPGTAIGYFCLVVNLTIVATSIIDSRLLWKENHPELLQKSG